MVHKLAIVAVIGLSASAVCIGAAAAIGGRELRKELEGMDLAGLSSFGGKPRCERVTGSPNRDLEWDGSESISLAVPAHARYSPTNGKMVHVSGNPQAVAHVRVRDGRVEMDCSGNWRFEDSDLQITLPGGEFRKFGILGAGKLTLEKLDQRKLKVSIAGSGSIKAEGRVAHTEIHIAGSGDADLGRVQSHIAMVHIAGSGNTDIAPSEEADIHIAGSGDVNLHTSPKNVETHIAGSGRIRNVGDGG